jgi:anaerobic selenocysteine-containing dehydrogenase
VRPGTDGALALAACRVVIDEKLYQADYLREQTDLPFLVRADDGRFLREADAVEGGSQDRFAIWDEAEGSLFWAPGSAGSEEKTLALPAGLRPALELDRSVRLANGAEVRVRTVFSLLREGLAELGPEEASAITGIAPEAIRSFARGFARAGSSLILSQWGMCKNYHSDLIQRSQILLASLTGNLGRAGGGWRSGGFIALDGFGLVAMQERLGIPQLLWTMARAYWDPAALRHEFESVYVPSSIFHAVHGGLGQFEGAAEHGDPALKRGAAPFLEEAVRKGHFPIGPPPGQPPECIFSFCGNVLRHSRMGQYVRDTLFAQAKLVVDVNWRLNETGRYADILLPSAGWYEKVGLKYIVDFVPYLTLADKGTEPLAESKPEWEIFSLLAQRVAAEARRQNLAPVTGYGDRACDIATLDDRFSDFGRFGPHDQEAVASFILSMSGAASGIGLEDLRREGGALRIPSLGDPGGMAGVYSDYSVDEPMVPMRDFVEKKQPYPTLTGRQQFYVDHPWFLQVGEQLPVHKEPPAAGGNHPFTLTGAHARWSIHSMWRDHELMLRLQRGEPVIFLNDDDARTRGIADHALVRVWNDLGDFTARAKLSGSIRPAQAHIFHSWEPFQFRSGTSHQGLAPSPFKITQLVGDYGHLHWAYAHYEPNQVDRDTRVDVAPLPG